jgi:hypothetical protein
MGLDREGGFMEKEAASVTKYIEKLDGRKASQLSTCRFPVK